MPTQEAVMPPTLPYPFSSSDENISSLSSAPISPPSLSSPFSDEEASRSSVLSSSLSDDGEGNVGRQSFSTPNGTRISQKRRNPYRQPRTCRSGQHSSLSTSCRSLLNGTASIFNPTPYNAAWKSNTPRSLEHPFTALSKDLATPRSPNSAIGNPLRLPTKVFSQILSYLDRPTLLSIRAISSPWRIAAERHSPLRFPAFYRLPVELIQLILSFASPGAFNSGRHICRAWYFSSLEPCLLRKQLKELGFYYTAPSVPDSKNACQLAGRFSRECALGGDGSGVSELCNTAIIDLTELAGATTVHFTVSICGSYVLLSEGCVVYVYRLHAAKRAFMEFVTSVICPRRVLAVSMDTSSRRFAIAILLDGRMGLVHDVVEQEAKNTYRNLCSEDDVPRSVAICPQRRCVAFGCQGGIELHWISGYGTCTQEKNGLCALLLLTDEFNLAGVDALTGQDLNRWFPLTAPSDFLYFLPPRRGIDSAKKLRLISSAVHPDEVNPLTKRFGVGRGSLAYWGNWEPRSGQSDHFQAVPLSDGYHILFTDPTSGGLCLGSDAPLGGPTKLLRKIWLVPPEDIQNSGDEELGATSWSGYSEFTKTNSGPSVYASGADLSFGVKVVAGYTDKLVLYSVPPDIFNDAKDKNEGEDKFNYNNTTFPMPAPLSGGQGVNLQKPTAIKGSYIGTVPGLIDIAVDSGPDMVVYAFSARGLAMVYQLDRTSAVAANGEVLKRVACSNGDIVTLDKNGAKEEKGKDAEVGATMDGEYDAHQLDWQWNGYAHRDPEQSTTEDLESNQSVFWEGTRVECELLL